MRRHRRPTFIRHYARYGGLYEDEFDTLHEALETAVRDNDYGEAYTIRIIRDDGEVVANHDALFEFYVLWPDEQR